MTRSARLRLQDLRDIHQLVAECRELGDSASAWRAHLLGGAMRLVGAGVGQEYETVWEPRDTTNPRDLLGAIDRWDGGFNLVAFEELFQHLASDGPSFSPLHRCYAELLRQGVTGCWTQSDIVPDRDWYASPYYDIHRSVGVGPLLYTVSPCRQEGVKSSFHLGRGAEEPNFSPRALAIVRELHSDVTPLIEGPLAAFREPSPEDLTPRTRQVLRCLLEGDGDKQVAARLGLSRHTVNTYIRHIFAHFNVTSRPELMARWIRRGWGLSSGKNDIKRRGPSPANSYRRGWVESSWEPIDE